MDSRTPEQSITKPTDQPTDQPTIGPFVGIDVAKALLDLALRYPKPDGLPTIEDSSASNDEQGIAEVVSRLQRLQPALVVLEATSGYQVPLVGALGAASLPWWLDGARSSRC